MSKMTEAMTAEITQEMDRIRKSVEAGAIIVTLDQLGDPEVEALRLILQYLRPFDRTTRLRMVSYLQNRIIQGENR